MTMKRYLPLVAITCVPLLMYSRGVTGSSAPHSQENAQHHVSKERNYPSGTTPTSPSSTEGELLGDSPSDVELGVSDRLSVEETYASAKDALYAVSTAAKNYDNDMLEKFKLPGTNCSWCEEFYSQVRGLLSSESMPLAERHYMALLLAESGRPENIEALIDAAVTATSTELKNLFSEALELTVGNDEVVRFLGMQLEKAPEGVRESIGTALTRQSSLAAAEELYRQARINPAEEEISFNDGIGLEELAATEEVLPFLSEIVRKRDEVSNLAAVALINSGEAGFREFLTVIESPEYADTQLLDTVLKNVAFSEDVQKIAQERLGSVDGTAKEFLEKVAKGKDLQMASTPSSELS